MKQDFRVLLGLVLFAAPITTLAQFTYQTDNNTITITGYTGYDRAVTIPSTINGLPVVSVGDTAFYNKTSIASVTIPASVTSIGRAAFFLCTGLTNVTIPGSVTNLAYGAFSACTFLTNITVDALNQYYSSAAGVLFDKSMSRLIQCPAGKPGTYATPDSVTSIGDGAFYGCASLTGVVIGGGVTNIGGWLFYQSKIPRVTFLQGVTTIPFNAFTYCAMLTNVGIPSSITGIEGSAFQSCASLPSLTIPGGITNIASDALSYCTGLKAILFAGDAPSSVLDLSGDNAVVIYYLPGTSGWSSLFAGRPTALWNPLFQAVGTQPQHFSADIVGTTNIPILVEASADLTTVPWQPLATCSLTNGSFSFDDPSWTNYPARFYRIRWPWQ